MITKLTDRNIEQLVGDLKASLGIELFTKEDELLDELIELAINGLEHSTEDADADEEIERLKSIIDNIRLEADY